MKKSLLLLFAAFATLAASAQTKVEIEGIWYNLTSETQQAEVTSKSSGKYSGSITIPATVTYEGVDYSVTSIGSSAFKDCRSLTAITLPEGVTSIGEDAFQHCRSLTAITIPEGVTSIGYYAFEDCSSLTAVHISDITAWCNIKFSNSTSNPLNCAQNLYLNGELVTQLTIPEGVTSIGNYAFYGCSSLTTITIPEGVTSIGEYAFGGCRSLTAITIPEGVTSIGNYTFVACRSLTAITLPEGVTSIGGGAFQNCTGLTAINIPESVTSIGEDAFRYCSSLTAITLPEGVTSIGWSAFYNCSSLTAIVLPKNLNYIGYRAFAYCSELLDVYCYAEEVPSTESDPFEDSYPEYATLHVVASALEAYKTTAPWSRFGKFEILTPTPGTITITINQYGSATYCSEYALDFSNVEGLKAYAATGYNNITGIVTLTRVMTTQPSTGIFVKGEPGTYEVPVIEASADHTTNMLVPTLTETVVNSVSGDGLYANYKYTVAEGETEPLFHRFMDGSTLNAGKAYLQIPMAWLPTNAARSIGLRFDEGTTSIENIEPTANSQQPTAIYDLQGRRVAQPVKGVYIINGKKVVL